MHCADSKIESINFGKTKTYPIRNMHLGFLYILTAQILVGNPYTTCFKIVISFIEFDRLNCVSIIAIIKAE